MRLHLAIAGFLLTLATGAQAECECLWQGSFVDVHAQTDLVVVATVVARKGNSIDLQIDQRLSGSETTPPVRVWLKTGDYCRPPADTFPPGSQWVMALHQITQEIPGGFDPFTPNVSFGRQGDFSLSSCGGYWLSRKEGWVSGNLVDAPRWEREPKMTPVLLQLVASHVNGELDANALLKASREDPALRELILDTRAFLRKEN
ncbi:MAG: hypothetical protein ACI9NT_001079 [Bacteroidia bacterium]|jgi:hypothetical protein